MPSHRSNLVVAAIASASVVLASLPGCSSSSSKMLPSATPVSGTLTRADGTPIGNVTLMLQPLSTGHMTSFEVAADGTFSGEAVAGPYAWFVTKSSKATDTDAAIDTVPEDFRQGKLERKVTVGSSPLTLSVP